jgi:hypothetical protein
MCLECRSVEQWCLYEFPCHEKISDPLRHLAVSQPLRERHQVLHAVVVGRVRRHVFTRPAK